MSSNTFRNNINRINLAIADLLKKQTAERKKEVNLNSKINELNKKLVSAKTLSAIQNYQRQIESKSKELIRVGEKVADYHKKIANKNKELSRNQDSLTKAIATEKNKIQSDELRFLKEKESLNRSEVDNIRSINRELEKQHSLFENYMVNESELTDNDEEYSLPELMDLHSRIDEVLSILEKLGFGQEILFEEIEELKSKSKKITKKDLKMMLIGKLVSFSAGKIDAETASQIFETITNIHLTKYIK